MLDKMKEIISQYVEIAPDDINEETSLRGDLGLNSFDIVNISVVIEEELGVEIKESKIPSLYTVGDVIEYVEKRKQD